MATDKTGYVSVGAEIEDEVMPDRAIFSIGFGGRRTTKESCLEDYNTDRARVAAALAPFGLDSELTCCRYTCYAQMTRKKATIVGYNYYAYGTVAAPVDSTDFAAVWTALNTCESHPDMSIRFELADQRAAEDALIARAAWSMLGGVKHISYNSRAAGYGRTYCVAACAPDGASGGSEETVLEPEPIEVECSVDMEWWLE